MTSAYEVEPRRVNDVSLLKPAFAYRLGGLVHWLRTQGFEPRFVETWRSKERQKWLWGIGRSHSLDRREVTWSRHSRHQDGLAADLVSEGRGYDDPRFFDALASGARRFGLKTYVHDRCHVEME